MGDINKANSGILSLKLVLRSKFKQLVQLLSTAAAQAQVMAGPQLLKEALLGWLQCIAGFWKDFKGSTHALELLFSKWGLGEGALRVASMCTSTCGNM